MNDGSMDVDTRSDGEEVSVSTRDGERTHSSQEVTNSGKKGESGSVSTEPLRRTASLRRASAYTEHSETDIDDYESGREEKEDNNDECCTSCGTDEVPTQLLCCENCPKVYHLYCLQPPLSCIPRGDWYCPDCEKRFALSEAEKILAQRISPEDEKSELYVKWRKKSYRHCSWVQEEDMASIQKLYPSVRAKLRKWNKQQKKGGVVVDNPEEYENGVNKKWLLVEKIISQSVASQKDGGLLYLVKWQGLPHDECTWEKEEDMEEFDQEKIEAFQQELTIVEEARMRKRADAHSSQQESRGRRRKKSRRGNGKLEGQRMYNSTPAFLGAGMTLHPYQLEGLNWMFFKWQQRENVILADEMGLGKTIQSISFIASLWKEYVEKPHLVVVPLSTMPNWEREFALWAPQLNVVSLTGSQETRDTILKYGLFSSKKPKEGNLRWRKNLQQNVKFHVCLVSYELCCLHSSSLSRVDYECLIVDEGHRLKGKNSRLVKELNNFTFTHRVLLSGTPLQNNIQELFMLMHFLDGRKFDSWEEFEKAFSDISQEDQVSRLHSLLSPHLLRRLKKDVIKQLPPKKEQIVRIELSSLQREVYKQILTQNYQVLDAGKSTTTRKSMRNVVMELRKCCLHPYLIDGVEHVLNDPKLALQKLVEASGKLDLLHKMLQRLLAGGHRVLIYSQFVMMLDILEEYVIGQSWGHQRIDGNVGGPERQLRIDRFNNQKEKYPIFLLSTKAGGLGINLATADTVIIYDSDWNPHNDLQAQARAHRLGQQNAVMVYRLVTRFSIEERMMQMAKSKMVLEHLVVRKMGAKEGFKQEELDDILRYGAQELFDDNAKDENSEEKKKNGEENDKEEDGKGRVMLVREREAARLKVNRSDRIVYDDAALDRLLDRSELNNPEEKEADEEDEEAALMTSFKVANFDVINSSEKEEAPNGESKDEPSKPEVDPEFWKNLLKDRFETMREASGVGTEELAGRRNRRRVNYQMEGSAEMDVSTDEYEEDAQSQDGSLFEESMEKGRGKKRKDSGMLAAAGEASKRVKVRESNEKPPLVTPGPNPLILGFTLKERQVFLHCLMRHGLPEGVLTGQSNVDWSDFTNRFSRKKHNVIDDYARIVVAAAGGNCVEGIKPEDVLFDTKVEDLLARIGMIHLFRTKLREPGYDSRETFNLKSPSAKLLKTKVWTPSHDWALLNGVIRYGYGRWRDILRDPTLNLEEILYQELNIDLADYIDPNTSNPSAPGANAVAQRNGSHATKLRSMETRRRNWLANRLKLLADALNDDSNGKNRVQEGGPSGVPEPVRPPPQRPPGEGPVVGARTVSGGRGRSHPFMAGSGAMGRGRGGRVSQGGGGGGGGRGKVGVVKPPLLPGLQVLQWYPGSTAPEIRARVQLVRMYNAMCATCQKVRADASAVRSERSEDALTQAGIMFRHQLEELERQAVGLIEKMPAVQSLPVQNSPTAQPSTPSSQFVFRTPSVQHQSPTGPNPQPPVIQSVPAPANLQPPMIQSVPVHQNIQPPMIKSVPVQSADVLHNRPVISVRKDLGPRLIPPGSTIVALPPPVVSGTNVVVPPLVVSPLEKMAKPQPPVESSTGGCAEAKTDGDVSGQAPENSQGEKCISTIDGLSGGHQGEVDLGLDKSENGVISLLTEQEEVKCKGDEVVVNNE
ncbi:hypothetical protein BSKO_03978 [Bryopsis sp. KO-2023]|nr:hypothetical protein BSKO_03978 [Bryopsis sp. KO-2023]